MYVFEKLEEHLRYAKAYSGQSDFSSKIYLGRAKRLMELKGDELAERDIERFARLNAEMNNLEGRLNGNYRSQ